MASKIDMKDGLLGYERIATAMANAYSKKIAVSVKDMAKMAGVKKSYVGAIMSVASKNGLKMDSYYTRSGKRVYEFKEMPEPLKHFKPLVTGALVSRPKRAAKPGRTTTADPNTDAGLKILQNIGDQYSATSRNVSDITDTIAKMCGAIEVMEQNINSIVKHILESKFKEASNG